MKITKYGTVTIGEDGKVTIEGFHSEGGSLHELRQAALEWAVERLIVADPVFAATYRLKK